VPRNGGSTVDAAARTIRDRNGRTYALDDVVVAESGLYFARTILNDHFWYQERWMLPAGPWVVNRFGFHPHRTDAVDWYIETDVVERDGDLWHVRDGFLDLFVYEGARYHVDDADELAEAIERSEISMADATAALRALDRLCDELEANGCSGAALLRAHAPGLPAPRLERDAAGVFSLASRAAT
jgi:predicted RNA-binding protein associated with RNAse of E/G family